MNALDSHDTAKTATVMIDDGQRLGAVLMFTVLASRCYSQATKSGSRGCAERDFLAPVRETSGSCVLVVVDRAAANVQLAPGTLTDSQRLALAADQAFRTGQIRAHISAGRLANGRSGRMARPQAA